MKTINSSIHSEAVRSITALRNLRKIKLFPRVSAVTVVAYYKNNDRKSDAFVGKAFTLDFLHLQKSVVEVAHNDHSPPRSTIEEEEKKIEEEEDSEPTIAIGFQALAA